VEVRERKEAELLPAHAYLAVRLGNHPQDGPNPNRVSNDKKSSFLHH